jgi:hypothetical protein
MRGVGFDNAGALIRRRGGDRVEKGKVMRLKSQELSAAQRAKLTPEYLANEAAYWGMHEELLRLYRGEWVGVFDGAVVFRADSLAEMMRRARRAPPAVYIDRVGREFEVQLRIRRAEFGYDRGYGPALPRAEVTFSGSGSPVRERFSDTIPDTGADFSSLPEADCQDLQLWSSHRVTMEVSGLGPDRVAELYLGFASVADGPDHDSLIESNPHSSERLLGREVLNEFAAVTFRGKEGRVVFEE